MHLYKGVRISNVLRVKTDFSLRRILSRLPTANILRLSNAQASLAFRSA